MGPVAELVLDEHYGIGPLADTYDHGPVTVFNGPGDDAADLYACLDCGYVTNDVRRYQHVECDPAENTIAQSWRAYLDAEGYPESGGEWVPPHQR